MDKSDDYRRFAAASLDLASRATDAEDKARLLRMAEAWLNLADHVVRLAKQRARIEPIVKIMLGEAEAD